MSSDLVPPTYPKVPTWRRSAALGTDLFIVWLLSSLLAYNGLLRFFVFILFWLTLRVFLVAKNQGQSLGRWAFDHKVIDPRYNKTPGLLELSRREGVMGICVYLATLGLSGLVSGNAGILLFWIPISVDCGLALFDTSRNPQTFHDRFGRTFVIGTQRGYSLDIKIRNWVDKMKKDMK
ncbi:RDD family protein [Capilliphycus salinus ALCB114379]|uniref:RDD family protein n=1 Tax=Capilliphycus salinus TaxID=2768948 RepID=UPI0039A4C90C